MRDLMQVLQEVWHNFPIANRLARFNVRSRWADNYLGSVWDYLEPLMYIGTYFVVFGMGLYNGNVAGVPYILWLLTGIVPWYFIQGAFNKGLTSVSSQLNLLTKTNYPMSIAPLMPLLEEIRRYFVLTIFMVMVLIAFGYHPSIYWIQILYAIPCMLICMFAIDLLNSTLTIVVPDYKTFANSLFRLIFFFSGIVINIDAKNLPVAVVSVIKMMPFYYIIQMFRDTFLYHRWFWQQPSNTLFFWLIVTLILIGGAHLHVRFRNRFTDLM